MAELPTFDMDVLNRAASGSPRDVAQAAGDQLVDDLRGLNAGAQEVASDVGSFETNLGQEIVRGLFRRRFGIDIPSPEERQNRDLLSQIRNKQLRAQNAKLDVDRTFAAFLNNKDILQQLAPGIKVDESLMERPQDFVTLARASGLPIDLGTLHLAGVQLTTPEDQQQAETEKGLKKTQTALAGAEAGAGLLQLVEQFKQGTSPIFQTIAQQVQQVGEARGVNLTGFDTEIDEDLGAATFFENVPQMFRTAQGLGLNPDQFAPLLLSSDFGADITDQLEEVPRDENGNIISGQGHAGATPRAVFYMLLSLAKISQESNIPIERVMQRVGANGIEEQSLRQFADAEAERLGLEDGVQLMRQFGLSR